MSHDKDQISLTVSLGYRWRRLSELGKSLVQRRVYKLGSVCSTVAHGLLYCPSPGII